MITDRFSLTDKVDGGVQAVTRYLVEAINSLKAVDLHIVCFDHHAKKTSVVQEAGLTKHVIPASRFGTLTAFLLDQRAVNRCLRHIAPDVVHGQGAGRNGILAARSPYPSVITIHGILTEEARFFVSSKRRIQHRALALLSDHYCIRRATHTILISPYVADYYADRLGGQKHLIPNPIADDFFKIQRNTEPGCILYAGRLLPLKGVIDLIRACALLVRKHSIRLVLAGSQEQKAYVEKLQAEVQMLGLEKNIEFRGLLNEEEIRSELGRCSMLVLPSYQETAPMVIAEAMAAGVPVVASDVGGVRYQLDDGNNGFLINPGDVKQLAEKIDQLLSHPEMLQAFSMKAKKSASDQYLAESIAKRTIDVYKSIIPASQNSVLRG